MPELPEVQATVDYLRERVEGEVIERAAILWHRTISGLKPQAFEERIAHSSIEGLFRRGKFVGLKLFNKGPLYVFVHLRMSGSLDVVSSDSPIDKHDRVILHLANGKSIRFNDTRKFGRIYLCSSPEDVVGKLGPEPLSDEFTPTYLAELLRTKRTRIKPLLLDQSLIAGLGNIYVDESLWKAQVHPLSPAHRLGREKIEALHSAIRETLQEAISLLGTDFGDGVVEGGLYSPMVYGRDGEQCHRCTGKLVRIVVGQRGTHLCTKCQPKPRAIRQRKGDTGATVPNRRRSSPQVGKIDKPTGSQKRKNLSNARTR